MIDLCISVYIYICVCVCVCVYKKMQPIELGSNSTLIVAMDVSYSPFWPHPLMNPLPHPLVISTVTKHNSFSDSVSSLRQVTLACKDQ